MTDSRPPSHKQDQYMLRLPDGMRDRIKRTAEANNRSMNAEIVAALEEKYPAPLKDTDFEKAHTIIIGIFEKVLAQTKSPEARSALKAARQEIEANAEKYRAAQTTEEALAAALLHRQVLDAMMKGVDANTHSSFDKD